MMARKDELDELDEDMVEGEDEDTQKGKFLTFVLAKEEYGIEISHVKQIIGLQNITEVPDKPAYILGVINLRGSVIPIMDVRLRFAMEKKAYDDRTCIVVTNVEDKTVGLLVDTVSEVLDIPATQIEEPPKVNKGEASKFIKGIGKTGDKVKIILNVETLVFDRAIEETAAQAK